MEKRLFIAVALSFLVLFLFQPKAVKDNKNQPVDNKTVAVVDKKQAELQVSPSPHSPLSVEDPRDRVEVEANGRKIVFSRRGGSISSLRLDAYDHDLVVGEIAGLPELDGRVFDLKTVSLTEYWMQSLGDDLEVVKKYDLSDSLNIRIAIEISNKKSEPVLVGRTQNFLEIDASSLDKNQNKSDWTLFEYAIKTEKKIFRKNNAHSFSDKWNKEWSSSTRWIGFRDRYFAVIVAPQKDSQKAFSKYIDEKRIVLGGEADGIEILPGQKASLDFVIYAGPQDPKSLKAAGEGFEEIMVFSDWGWLDAIAKAIYWLLFFCHNILQSWGLCIIFVSLFVYSCLYPLTMKSLVSMRKMQTLQPKIAEIKKAHEKDPQKMN
ncbi:MAG: membrane protein insertase YidC, partial [Elusimicrobia bacterium]|nr:membrane protein insertase YidC [Elusimicrobiota bacterium]